MKNIIICALLSVMAVATAAAQRPKTILNPPYTLTTSITRQISAVTLTDTSTVILVKATYNPGYVMGISKTTVIESNGNKYMLKSASGVSPGTSFRMPESGEAYFTLYFEPLPFDTKRFDFIEDASDLAANFYGVELKNKVAIHESPDDYLRVIKTDLSAPLPKPVLKAGMARIEGRFMDWKQCMPQFTLFTYTYVESVEHSAVSLKVDNEGRFVAEIYLPSTSMLWIRDDSQRVSLTLICSLGETQRINISLAKLFNQNFTANKDLRRVYSDNVYTNAWNIMEESLDLNSYLDSIKFPSTLQQDVYGMATAEYGHYWHRKYMDVVAKIQLDNTLHPLFKHITKNYVAQAVISKLLEYDYQLSNAWAIKHGTRSDSLGAAFKYLEKPDSTFYSFIKEIDFDTDTSFVFGNLGEVVYGIQELVETTRLPSKLERITLLCEKGNINDEDRETLKAYLEQQNIDSLYKKMRTIVCSNQDEMSRLINDLYLVLDDKIILSDFIKVGKGYIWDYMLQRDALDYLESQRPLCREQLDSIRSLFVNKDMFFIIEDQNIKLINRFPDRMVDCSPDGECKNTIIETQAESYSFSAKSRPYISKVEKTLSVVMKIHGSYFKDTTRNNQTI